MALASLGGVTFRLNPTDVAWTFELVTSVTQTIGGRVVQVIGANLSDITVRGYYGQEHIGAASKTSALLAEEFVKKMRLLMIEQSKDAKVHGGSMHEPIDFVVPDFGWHMKVFLKAIQDEGGAGAISHSPDHFSYQYIMTLFPVQEGSTRLTLAGMSNGVMDKKKAQAISAAVARISAGVGWKPSPFNDYLLEFDANGNVVQAREAGENYAIGSDPEAGAAAAAAGAN